MVSTTVSLSLSLLLLSMAWKAWLEPELRFLVSLTHGQPQHVRDMDPTLVDMSMLVCQPSMPAHPVLRDDHEIIVSYFDFLFRKK